MAETWTFERAQEWLAQRQNVPTTLSSRHLSLAADFPARAKAQAFFSARVSSANILDAFREQVQRLTAGEIDYATARMQLKTFLAAQGIPADDVGMTDSPPPGVSLEDWKARREITNLASTRRLDLVLRQNTGMAQAVGRRQVSMEPTIRERWPYYRYIARMDGRERPEHGRLNNLVLRKDDPFWRTHTPPWEFGCRCDIEDADEEDARRYGTGQTTAGGKVSNPATGQTAEALPNESGFEFDIDAAMSSRPEDYDWGAIRNGVLRERAERHAAEYMSEYGVRKTPVPPEVQTALDRGAIRKAEKSCRDAGVERVDFGRMRGAAEGMAEALELSGRSAVAPPREIRSTRLPLNERGEIVIIQANVKEGSLTINSDSMYARAGRDDMALAAREAHAARAWTTADWRHPFVHDLMHLEHARRGPQARAASRSALTRSDLDNLAPHVDEFCLGCALRSPMELVAEVSAGIVLGRTFPDGVMAVYRRYGGWL